ncbi:alkaline phosphatase D family protein [Sphingobacterium mizutaii]|uniref:alkaline phosphatase D family protein n=1 Tax=Sphingobacterium mizutaii TaxID=1010 RepID=UPI00162318DC|nr:alkaline phosphatase D family protein [Sphingobacterium mizutaii]
MPKHTEYNLIGAITPNSAIISTKIEHTPPQAEQSELKILKVRYHANDGMRVYINNELVSTDTSRTGNFAFVENMMIGGDADEVDFFKGYLAELVIYNDYSSNSNVDGNVQLAERYLADKWLNTGTILGDGYVVGQTQSGGHPMELGLPDNLRWLQINETSYTTDSNDNCTQINDFVGYGGVLKQGLPTTNALPAKVLRNHYKGKDVLYFDGESNYKITGLKQTGDPDYITLFMVFAFEDLTGDQTVIGAINDANDTYNNPIRIKKYSSDAYLSVRLNTGGFSNGQVSSNKVYSVGVPANILLGQSKIKYSINVDMSNSITTSSLPLNSNQNGVAKHRLTGLTPNTQYYAKVLIDDVEVDDIKFKTFPTEGTPASFKFVAGSCNYTASNTETWDEIRKEQPLFWAHLGDWHYEDITINNIQLFRDAFAQSAKQPRFKALNNNVPLCYIWDDHDYGDNNSDKNSPSKEASTAFYLENIPHYDFLNNPNANALTDSIGQSWIVGRVLFIMTDLRSQRDSFLIDDYDPNKKMMGDVQKAWFKNTLLNAKNNDNIGLICWLNPTSWTGEDLDGYSWDFGSSGEHWTAYKAERTELWNWMNDNDITNMFIINGDTHQIAVDDGRNAIFDTMYPTTLDFKSFPENRLTPIFEASAFDRDVDRGSGQFQINDEGDSGSVAVLSEKTYSTFEIVDEGSEWIKVIIKQYCLPDGLTYYQEKTLVNQFEFVRHTNGFKAEKPEIFIKEGVKKLVGKINTSLVLATSPSPITFTAPATFQNNWKAPITGVVNGDKSNRIVRVFRRSDSDYLVGECPVDAVTGEFTFAGSKGISPLVFRIYDSVTDTLISELVNDGVNGDTYTSIEAQLFVVSDIDYYQASTTIGVESGYYFNVDNVNEDKIYKVKIIEKSTNAVLGESKVKGWLPRSYTLEENDPAYITPFASKNYLYDAGLALISFTGTNKNKDAERIAKGIIKSQFANGSFPFSTNHINPTGADAYLRSGAVAWVAYSLSYYLKFQPNTSIKNDIEQSLTKVLDYLITLQDPTKGGLIKGGSGTYTTSGGIETFDPNYIISWVSSEHNIDAYFAFKIAGEVLDNPTYTSISNEIGDSIINLLYDPIQGRMYQGLNADGSPDTADALDINSWGAVCMVALGRNDYAEALIARAERYYYCTDITTGAKGFKPYSAELGYPSALDTVWFEGSFGVALAYAKVGNTAKYNELMNDLYKYKEFDDGAFRYATLRDSTYEISNNKSVASTAWYVIANNLTQSVWQ